MQVQESTVPEYDTRVAGVPLCNEVVQHIFGFATLSTLGKSASVCRFFNANVKAMIKRMCDFKTSVGLLKTIPVFKDINNMFDSGDVPTVLRHRYDLIHKLIDEEKLLKEKGVETSNKRIILRAFAKRYAELGDINHAIALLVEVDLGSLKSLASCDDIFEKADRLSRIVQLMGQVAQFVSCYENLVKPQTKQRLSDCITQILNMTEPLEKVQIYQYKGFDDILKQNGFEVSYKSVKEYSKSSSHLHSTRAKAAAADPTSRANRGLR